MIEKTQSFDISNIESVAKQWSAKRWLAKDSASNSDGQRAQAEEKQAWNELVAVTSSFLLHAGEKYSTQLASSIDTVIATVVGVTDVRYPEFWRKVAVGVSTLSRRKQESEKLANADPLVDSQVAEFRRDFSVKSFV